MRSARSGDEELLGQVLDNILPNAIRYAQKTVTATVACLQETVSVTVSDDGGGIAPEDLPHIFERCYKGKGGNFGIGLTIARSAALKMEGRLTAENPRKAGRRSLLFEEGIGINVRNRTFKRGSEYEKALSELVKREDALRGKLCPDGGEALAAYAQAYANLNSIYNLENFSIGFGWARRLCWPYCCRMMRPSCPSIQSEITKPSGTINDEINAPSRCR